MAMHFVSNVSAPLDPQDATQFLAPIIPTTEEIFTIDPPPAFLIHGSTSRDVCHTAFTLMSNVLSHCSSVRLSAVPPYSTPEVFKSTFKPPNFSAACRTTRRMSSTFRKSPTHTN